MKGYGRLDLLAVSIQSTRGGPMTCRSRGTFSEKLDVIKEILARWGAPSTVYNTFE